MPAMKRYVIRHAIKGTPYGNDAYATQERAEKAATTISARMALVPLHVLWCNDAGVPVVAVARVSRGIVTRTPESPIS